MAGKLQHMKDAYALAKNPKGTRKRRKAIAEAVKEANKERARAMRARKRQALKQAEDALRPSKMMMPEEWMSKMDEVDRIIKNLKVTHQSLHVTSEEGTACWGTQVDLHSLVGHLRKELG